MDKNNRREFTANDSHNTEKKNDDYDKLLMSPAIFNRAGFTPTAASFTITKSKISEEIKKIAINDGLDIVDANVQYDFNNNILSAFVFIPDTSKHLVDDLSNNEQSAIRTPIYNFSPTLKSFMDKFSPEKNKKVTGSNRGGLKCIFIDIFKVIDYLFDGNNSAFSKKYNKPATRCKLLITPEVRGKEFLGITIEKKTLIQEKYELLPKRSHNF